MKKKYLLIILSTILVVWSTIVYLFFKKVDEMKDNNPSDYYLKDEYSGKVINKFIDKKQHNYKTIVIKQAQIEHSVIFSFVMDDLFEFIKIEDSLTKKSGALDLRLKRKNLDTLITMKIFGHRK